MKAPQNFDPNSNLNARPTISATNSINTASSCSVGGGQSKNQKSPAIPKGMPSITDNHKQLSLPNEKPFKIKFFQPKYWGIWLALIIVLPLLYLPLSWQFTIGRFFGALFYKLSASHRKVALVNLTVAFPDKSESEREQMARQAFVNQGIGIFESLCAWFRPNLFTRTVSIEGLQYLVTAQKEGKSVLLLGGHYTMLDLGSRLCTQFFPLSYVNKPHKNALLEWFIFNGRRNIFGSQINSENMDEIISEINLGHVILYYSDQGDASKVTIPKGVVELDDKENPPIFMALHTYRETPDKLKYGKRPHYHITITPALKNYPSQDKIADAIQVNKVLEELIAKDPAQWIWFHNIV